MSTKNKRNISELSKLRLKLEDIKKNYALLPIGVYRNKVMGVQIEVSKNFEVNMILVRQDSLPYGTLCFVYGKGFPEAEINVPWRPDGDDKASKWVKERIDGYTVDVSDKSTADIIKESLGSFNRMDNVEEASTGDKN